MKPLNNYILERLNPRHLGSLINIDLTKPYFLGKVDWNLENEYFSKKFKRLEWTAGTIYDTIKKNHVLIIWDKSENYMLTLTLSNARNWLGEITWDLHQLNKLLITKEKLFDTLKTAYAYVCIRSPKRTVVYMPNEGCPEIINDVINTFIEMYKNEDA